MSSRLSVTRMLFTVLTQLAQNPTWAVVTVATFFLSIVIAITVHEFSHAWSAYLLGDTTAKSQGRLTLNPVAHLDPAGTALIIIAGFGWGKPTPVNPSYFRSGVQLGTAMVALAGPMSNIAVASILGILVKLGVIGFGAVGFSLFSGQNVIEYFVGSIIFINLLLAAFNLLPIAPLDGFKVVLGVLPKTHALKWASLEPYGALILLGIIGLSFFAPGLSILPLIIRPIVNVLSMIVLGGEIWR